jgi:hypothetical protein
MVNEFAGSTPCIRNVMLLPVAGEKKLKIQTRNAIGGFGYARNNMVERKIWMRIF